MYRLYLYLSYNILYSNNLPKNVFLYNRKSSVTCAMRSITSKRCYNRINVVSIIGELFCVCNCLI